MKNLLTVVLFVHSYATVASARNQFEFSFFQFQMKNERRQEQNRKKHNHLKYQFQHHYRRRNLFISFHFFSFLINEKRNIDFFNFLFFFSGIITRKYLIRAKLFFRFSFCFLSSSLIENLDVNSTVRCCRKRRTRIFPKR